jgi:hypothetical protein
VLVTETSTSIVKGCTPVPKRRDVADSEVEEGLEKRGGVDLEGRDDGGYEKRLGKVMRVAMGIWMLLGTYLELTGERGNWETNIDYRLVGGLVIWITVTVGNDNGTKEYV